ncbi:hypothetical protein [Modestobacter sp. SYSU DS0290]
MSLPEVVAMQTRQLNLVGADESRCTGWSGWRCGCGLRLLVAGSGKIIALNSGLPGVTVQR